MAKAASCRYSAHNAFSLSRAKPSIAALTKLFRAQAATLVASKDVEAIAAWAEGAITLADNAHVFPGLSDYNSVLKGIAGKAAAAALRGAWGKGADAETRAQLTEAAKSVPVKAAGGAAKDDDAFGF